MNGNEKLVLERVVWYLLKMDEEQDGEFLEEGDYDLFDAFVGGF